MSRAALDAHLPLFGFVDVEEWVKTELCHSQEAAAAQRAMAQGALAVGPLQRRRDLRWDERLAITQSSLATQVPPLLSTLQNWVNLPHIAAAYFVWYYSLRKICCDGNAWHAELPCTSGPVWRGSTATWGGKSRTLLNVQAAVQEPILALRRQLAELTGERGEAGRCWLQAARACRLAGHGEVRSRNKNSASCQFCHSLRRHLHEQQ